MNKIDETAAKIKYDLWLDVTPTKVKEPPPEKCFAKMQSKDVAHKRLSGSSKMLVLKKKKIRSNKRPAWQSPYPL